jgi:hypothetical protein
MEDHSIKVYNGATGDYFTAFDDEVFGDGDSWDTTFLAIDEVGSYGEDDQINLENSNYGDTGWAGLAGGSGSGEACVFDFGTARLNSYYLDGYGTNVKKHAACHEVGHVIGLDHSSDDGCMNPDLGTTRPYPASEDVDMLDVVYCPSCDVVSFQGSNGKWLAAENGGDTYLVADRDYADIWETFRLRDMGAGQVAIQTFNGEYVAAEDGGGSWVIADRGEIGAWETFTLIDPGGGYVALETDDGSYLSIAGWSHILGAAATSVGSDETFLIDYH